MFRLFATAAVCLIAVSAAPEEGTAQVIELAKALDNAKLHAAEGIMNSQEMSRNQKKEAMNIVISKIEDPTRKAAAAKINAAIISLEEKMKSKLKDVVASLSPAAQELGKKILAETFGNVDAPSKEVASNIKALFDSASPDVQKELAAAQAAATAQVESN